MSVKGVCRTAVYAGGWCVCLLSPGAGEADVLWRLWSRDSVPVPPPCRCSVHPHLELSCTPATPPLAGWSAHSRKSVIKSQRSWMQPTVSRWCHSGEFAQLWCVRDDDATVSVLRTHLTINSVYFPWWNNFLNFSALRDQFHYWKPHWRMQINLICRRAFPSLLHRICFTVRIWSLKTSEYVSGAPAVYLNAAAATIVPVKMGFASDIDKNVLNCWKSR